MLKSIEKWASQSAGRERLLIILVLIGFGLLILLSTAVAALVIS